MQSNSISVVTQSFLSFQKEDALQDYNNQNIQEETRSNQNINNKVTKEEYTGASPGELIPIFFGSF